MKQFKTLLFATVLTIATVSLSQAQNKIAHINTQDLIQAMPEYKTAQTQLENLSKTYRTDMENSIKEYQTKAEQYDKEASSKSDEENAKRGQELQEKQVRIQQYQTDAQKDLQKKEFDLLKPITEKAKNAILKVANAQNFEYVLDTAQGVVIMAKGKDLLSDVKKELGI